ncbi:RNA polymerase sigma factor [Brevundimonas sp. NPDC092305]|uniref:RNA polymerase sigma factor n=1 Tax=Brevundimonas sp. NPDC092305 TaxID=3363957 RepID=UPI00382BCB0A
MASKAASANSVVNPRTEELYRDHARWLLRTLQRRFGGDVAEDLVQETYARLAKYGSVEIANPKPFLLTVARNAFLQGYKRDRRRSEAEQVQFALFGRTEASSQVETVVFRGIVLAMPVKLRDVFLLSRVGGLTNRQIGDQLGIAEKTVEYRMTRALAYCAAQLRR